MIERKTIVDQIEVVSDGSIRVRFAKLLVDGDQIIAEPKWHRMSPITPGTDVDAAFATVNDHLEQMGEARISDTEIARTKRVIAAAQAAI